MQRRAGLSALTIKAPAAKSSHRLQRSRSTTQRWNALSSTRWQTAVRSSAPEAHRANQSPPLKPTEPNQAEQPAREGRGLRNGRPIYLNVIDYILEVAAV